MAFLNESGLARLWNRILLKLQEYATKDDIPDTSNFIGAPIASVGQTIAVKTIDENNKPTEWEAVDITKELTKIKMIIDGDIINCNYDANAIAGMMSPDTVVIIERIGLNANGDTSTIYSQGYDTIAVYDASYNPVKFQVRFNFSDDIQSIVVDILNNTIILDPDWVAPIEPIPVPSTVGVGRVISVKSVDENSKPTEWEAIDPWIITSSTEGSTKKFKLTIDDDGVLSTEELTE